MSLYYTWYDIEKKVYEDRNKWPREWAKVDVYTNELIISFKRNFTEIDLVLTNQVLREMFGFHYSENEHKISLDYNGHAIQVIFEVVGTDEIYERSSLPLFKNTGERINSPQPLNGVPVVAFHSYKGGVGRTLSLLSAVISLSMKKSKSGNPFKVLIVDGDIEAPGMTWLAEKEGFKSDISFIDMLSIIHETKNWKEVAIPFITKKIEESVLRLPLEDLEVEHYFLPTYRDTSQVMSMPVTPEVVIQMSGREWLMADILSDLGTSLGVDAVFIDLRAGISEFAAPLLIDPRVKKFFVSSTSLQSRQGTQTILKNLNNRHDWINPGNMPVILMSMVPDEISNNDRISMEEALISTFKVFNNEEDYIASPGVQVEFLPFASNLVHLEGLDSISKKLNGTDMLKIIDKLFMDIFDQSYIEVNKNITEEKRGVFLNSLISQASEMEHAETTLFSSFLTTTALRNLSRKYRLSTPISVILGAKGSGKTFAYLQLLRSGTWDRFLSKVEGHSNNEDSTFIVPFLKPKNLAEKSVTEMELHLKSLENSIGFKMTIRELLDRTDQIELFNPSQGTEAEWKAFWRKLLLESTGTGVTTIDELQNYLIEKNKKIVFIIDGLEEIFQNVTIESKQRVAIRALTQGVINELKSIPDSRIGLLVFIRRDLAMNAIEQNWGQFNSLYEQYELKWTNVEALRLALWLCTSVDPAFYKGNVPIEIATDELLEEALYPLWGIKLGTLKSNEAYSANWIIAVLSDLNEQLQARDIIRFLKNAAEESKRFSSTSDRFLSPTAIRNAIKPCSDKKIEEITQEMPTLAKIFEKLRKKTVEQRQVPFQLEEYDISNSEAKLLEQQGYLVKLDDGFYMPEIIRRGLDFSLQRGARPKVFSLLKRAKRRL
ncbi:KGGVGR-motif variant AAA ATPase [Paenibacillus sp. DYY-L-2]|uniref:KGGVGR-motif variant AAA ATPase n=1 Tax=Paenibacillus sp. DYY-L-2 TaxID=3447013 RepID=UPI003F501623